MKKAIGVFQMIGGIYGITISIISLFAGNFDAIILLILFCLSTTAGFLLFKNYKFGRRLSILNHSLQLIRFNIYGVLFNYYSGLGIYLDLEEYSFGFSTKFGAGLLYGLVDSTNSLISLNILAAMIIFLLLSRK